MRGDTDVKPRKRPVQQRSRYTVEAILEAAARILEGRGLAGFNTNAIADRAGVGVASVYEYFPCKEAIAAELVLRAHLGMAASLRAALAETEGLSLECAVRVMIKFIVACECSRPQLARMLESEEEVLPKSTELVAAEAEICRLNMAFLTRHLGQVDGREVEIAAFDVHCIIRGLLGASLNAAPAMMISVEERLVRAVVGYLQPLLARCGID